MRLGTSSGGAPPGTGFRPGSGRKPPGTGNRLRTGVAPSGPGTQAAQGIALGTTVNISDRPVTGQGVMGMRGQTASGGGGRIVEDTSYYVGLIRKRLQDIGNESAKLKAEVDKHSKDTAQYGQLERKYEGLCKNKELLEGQLADYNLALDKTRTSTDPEDVQHLAGHLQEKNRQSGQELDRTFAQKKQREAETAQVEDQIEAQYRGIQGRIDELEPRKKSAYNECIAKQRELQERNLASESKIIEVNNRIRLFEADDKSSSLRKEFTIQEKQLQALRKDHDSLQEELDIASSADPKEAHARFVARVNDFKKTTKEMEEKAGRLREEIANEKKILEEMSVTTEEDSGEAAKYDLLVKRDQEMTAFMDKFDETRASVIEEQRTVKDVIVALLEHIGVGLEESTSMPSQEAMVEISGAKKFKEKNLATAKSTMESLQAEKAKREKELELLRQSEPKLTRELSNTRESMAKMRSEMQEFQDLDGLRQAFDTTQSRLQEQCQAYAKRREAIRPQVQALSVEHEMLKKQLSSSEVAKEIEETERRLKHYERSIFEIKEFVEMKTRETDYETVKSNCLKLVEAMNAASIKNCMQSPGVFAQAKW